MIIHTLYDSDRQLISRFYIFRCDQAIQTDENSEELRLLKRRDKRDRLMAQAIQRCER